MTAPKPRSRLLGTLLAGLAMLSPVAAAAQDVQTLTARADEAYNNALDAGRAERYDDACEGFKRAAVLYDNANYALMREPMQTDEDRAQVRSWADQLQAREDKAKEGAKKVCGLGNS